MGTNKNSVSGSWLGNYYYKSGSQCFGFEAVFAESNGSVEGSILDDSNLGEARLIGTFADPELSFTKKYHSGLHAIRYQGTLSDEGKKLTGTWMISPEVTGYWLAWRQDEENVPELEVEDEKIEERPKTAVMPAR